MAFAVGGYGIAICIATIALIRLSSVAYLPVVVRPGARCIPQRVLSVRAGFLGRNDMP